MLLPLRYRLQKHVAAWPWPRVGMLAGISVVLAITLVGYLFGVNDHFFSRFFTAFLVFFWLLAVTFLAVVPLVTWATGRWFGRGWADTVKPTSRPRRIASVVRPSSSPAASLRPLTR